jgi:hypothetical protein
VIRLGALGQGSTVNFFTADGTAVAGEDYEFTSGTLTFAPEQTEATIDVGIIANFFPEPEEFFSVILTDPVNGALIAPRTATVVISDDDGPPITPTPTFTPTPTITPTPGGNCSQFTFSFTSPVEGCPGSGLGPNGLLITRTSGFTDDIFLSVIDPSGVFDSTEFLPDEIVTSSESSVSFDYVISPDADFDSTFNFDIQGISTLDDAISCEESFVVETLPEIPFCLSVGS